MNTSRRVILFVLLTVSWPLQAGEMTVDFDASINFYKFQTYKWIPKSSLIRGTVPADAIAEEQADQIIQGVIDDALQLKGLRKVEGQKADLLVNYLGLVSYRILDPEEARKQRRSAEWIPYEHWRPLYEGSQEGYLSRQGSLSIDLVEAETNQLVWRGTATDVLDSPLQAGDSARLQEAERGLADQVHNLLRDYPPRRKKQP
jgi:hypothetical protein